MRRESHVRFGGRAGETHRSKGEKALRTYIPVQGGCLYLLAIMDWASRRLLAWRLSNTMDTECWLPPRARHQTA